MSLRQFTIGSITMGSVGFLRMLTQLFIVPALARYLSPADYGIVAIAMPFILFGMMFSDAGMSASLIRTTSKNVVEWSTSFWLTFILGLVLSLILVSLGYAISLFLDEPKLFPIIAVLSTIIFLQSIATVPGASLQQHHKFTTLASIEIVAMFASLAGTYIAATHGWGAWSLVVQQIVHYTIKLVLTLILSPFRPGLVFQIRQIIDHLTFGRDMIGNGFIGFMRQCLINMLTGKILGTSAVGLYTMANLFSDLPNRLVSGPIQSVAYPRISRLKNDPAAIRKIFLFLSRIIALLVIPVMGLLAVAHHSVFLILLSAKWQHAGYIFLLLAPGATVLTLAALRNTVAMALGRTDIILRQSWEYSILIIIALLCSVYFGIEVLVASISAVTVLYMPRALLQVFRHIDLPMRDFMAVCAPPFVTTMGAIVGYIVITGTLSPTDWECFSIAFFLGLLSLTSAFLFQFDSIKREIEYLRERFEEQPHSTVTA